MTTTTTLGEEERQQQQQQQDTTTVSTMTTTTTTSTRSTGEASSSKSAGDAHCCPGDYPIFYPMANRGDYTYASAKPLFLNVLSEAFDAPSVKKRLKKASVPKQALARWADFMASCYMQDSRKFHSFGHIMKLCQDSEPLVKVAVLFHDVAYFQVDNNPPPNSSRFLEDVLTLDEAEKREHIYRVVGSGCNHPGVLTCLKIFSIKLGQKLDPTIGLNEFASALIASRLLMEEEAVTLDMVAEICAVIEGTIPFRTNQWTERLHSNLLEANEEFKMGRTEEELEDTIRSVVNLANRDVGDFGEKDALLFLDGTWDLLVENNPRIWREGERCPVQVYRSGLQKTHGFLSTVQTKLIFSKFRDTPSQAHFDLLSSSAAKNVEVSRIYSGMKFVLCLIAEALEIVHKKASQVDPENCKKEVVSVGDTSDDLDRAKKKRKVEDGGGAEGLARSPRSLGVSRLLSFHRTIKHGGMDEVLTILAKHLMESFGGNVEKIEWLISNLKEEANPQPYKGFTRERALAILNRCPQNVVENVKRVFSL
ncbi:hypothetical protein HOP50_12g66340 [Chloropicon primus]|nr:hypothetical protein HOP50_12g66340 [Chloropicon primus]